MKIRTIVENAGPAAIVAEETKKRPRFDDAWLALTWLLAREPEKLGLSRVVHQYRFRLYKAAGDAVADTPDITVVYDVTENEVIIYGIRVEDRQDSPEI
jgi:hypothetical protein